MIDAIVDRARNLAPFLKLPSKVPQPTPEVMIHPNDPRFEAADQLIKDSLDLGTFGYQNSLREKYSFPLTGADFSQLRAVNRFIPSARRVGGRMEIYTNEGSYQYLGNRVAILLPEDEIAQRRIHLTSILIVADTVDESRLKDKTNPSPPYTEVTFTQKTRHDNGDPYWGPMRTLSPDQANPVLALQQIKGLMAGLRGEYHEATKALTRQATTPEEYSLIRTLQDRVEQAGIGLYMAGYFVPEDRLQKLFLTFAQTPDVSFKDVWQNGEFFANLPNAEYFILQGEEGIFNIKGNRLPVVVSSAPDHIINMQRTKRFQKFLKTRAMIKDSSNDSETVLASS